MNITTAEADWALKRIVARLTEHRQLMRTQTAASLTRGRHVARRRQTHDANALVDLVAIAESFCISRLIRIRHLELKDMLTWEKRQKAWVREASVDLRAFSDWVAFMGFVEVRNALQHGLGRLTDQQLGKRKQETLARLHAAAVQLNGNLVQLSTHDVGRCARVCRDLVDWLDSTAPAT